MNYEQSPNNTEIPSTDEQKLREICRSLPQIEPPSDFDFKIKARIAATKSIGHAPRFSFAFRYALPVFSLLLIAGILLYGGIFSPKDEIATQPEKIQNTNSPSESAIVAVKPEEKTVPVIENSANSNSGIAPTREEKSQIAETNLRKSNEKLPTVKSQDRGGSTDLTLGIEKPIQPDFKVKPQENKDFITNNPIPVKDILSMTAGINAEFVGGKWLVRSITAKSSAETSGIKENDIIEAIDDQTLATETIRVQSVAGKTITVIRNGQKQTIKLKK